MKPPLFVPVAPAPQSEKDLSPIEVITDPEELLQVNRDAAAFQGQGALGLLLPRSEAQLSHWLQNNPRSPLLVQGALTSLTGGATPERDWVLSSRKLNRLQIHPETRSAIVGPGVLVAELQNAAAQMGLYYPPAPTHDGATVGGNASTNAAGAATFKYGTTRQWVQALRLMLRNGQILTLRRGQFWAEPGQTVVLQGKEPITFQVPSYQSPALKKCSAGYYVRSPLDLIDLFIGSEGTLGIITELEVGLVPRPQLLTGLVFFAQAQAALSFVQHLRQSSLHTRSGQSPEGLDVRSIEFFDSRCLSLLRQENRLAAYQVSIPEKAEACLLFEQELPPGLSYDAIVEALVNATEEPASSHGPLGELMALLQRFDVVEQCELALPDAPKRQQQLSALREAIPLAISDWLIRQQKLDPSVHKMGGDMIVPMEQFAPMLQHYYQAFDRRGVQVAVFGHISDGNVHPNALPQDQAQMGLATEALLELADTAKSLGGCPLSEHGVGKHPLKKKMLADYWGPQALAQMKAVKQALDPHWTLARGVLFDPPQRDSY